MTLQDLIDALLVERFTYLPESRATDTADMCASRLAAATAEVMPERVGCLGCGGVTRADEPCPTCRQDRAIRTRRARLRAVAS